MSSTSNPYKNTYGRRRYRRRRYYKGRRAATYKIAQKAARSEIYKREKADVEMKSYDISFVGPQNVTYNGYVVPITPPIAKGLEPYNRVGSEIAAKGVLARLHMQPAAGWYSSGTTYMLRVIFIRWNSSGTPALNNILQFTGSVQAPYSPLLRDASHKFQVLLDNTFLLGYESDQPSKIEKLYLSKLGRCVWDDANGPQKGHIFACFISDGLVEVPNILMSARVRYTDS